MEETMRWKGTLQIPSDRPYGLVLEGGGARGAYQIGAYKALKEAGITFHAVAGTSVGALNGAFVCMDQEEEAEALWKDIRFSKVMQVEDDVMERLFTGKSTLRENIREITSFLTEGGADITPLKELIQTYVDESRIREGSTDFYVLTYSLSDNKQLDIDVRNEPEGFLNDYLLASAYLPIFKKQKLHGKRYMDGGMFNNVPLESLVMRGYKDIIMVRIYGPGREKKVDIPNDTAVYTVAPYDDLGSILDFSPKKSRRNLKLGYYDAMRLLYGLKGRAYYMDAELTEAEAVCCFQRLSYARIRQLFEPWYAAGRIQSPLFTEAEEKPSVLRTVFEVLLPKAAQYCRCDENWTYAGLYVLMTEHLAAFYRIPRFKVYTLKELTEEIQSQSKKKRDYGFFFSIDDKKNRSKREVEKWKKYELFSILMQL